MASASSGTGGRRNLRIGKYEVQTYIATGGMGAVYRALDVDLARPVALKILQPDLALKPKVVERFRREARSAARLNHEHIVTVYEFAEVDGTYLLALEFVEGPDLHEYVTARGKLHPEEARRITIQAARALTHAHAQGIVHRDIKPSNLLLTQKDGQPHLKLTDFGLARAVDQDDLPVPGPDAKAGPGILLARLTTLGSTVGTVDFMSPEQARDSGSADIRSDIYSLGCTLYFMLAGDCLFPDGTPSQRIFKHVETPPPDVRLVNSEVSDNLAAVLGRMLAKNPADRYQTPTELLKDLEDSEQPLPSPAPAVAVPKPALVKPPPDTVLDAPVLGALVKLPPPIPEAVRQEARLASAVARPIRVVPRPSEPGAVRRQVSSRSASPWPWIAAAAGALLLTGGGFLIFLRTTEPSDERTEAKVLPPTSRREPDSVVKPRPVPAVSPGPKLFPIDSTLPRLYEPFRPLDLDVLRADFEGPLASLTPHIAGAVIYRVSRTPPGEQNTFASLAQAFAMVPADQPAIIEIHDNGPLFEPSLPSLVTRNLVVRPGKGYRPLLAWDRAAGPQPGMSNRFVALEGGSLHLEDLDLVFQGTGGPDAEAPALFQVTGGTLTASMCNVSTAGSNSRGLVVVRLEGAGLSAACRLRRCYARGTDLTLVSARGAETEVLLDGCLVAGGQQPLLQVTTRDNTWATIRVVRSTLVGGKAILRLDAADGQPASPRILVRAWDALLAHGGQAPPGDLVSIGEAIRTEKTSWRAVNCLYAGWRNLMAAARGNIDGTGLEQWHKLWVYPEGDRALPQGWPEGLAASLELSPPFAFQTAGTPASLAASSHAGALGADPATVPAGRSSWIKRTYDFFDLPLLALPVGTLPAVPPAKPNEYAGERLDLARVDLGKHLETVLAARKPAPRVVMYLYGASAKPSSPIRVRGFDLVLCFVRVNPKLEPPTLWPDPTRVRERAAFLDVEDGSLEISGGKLSLAALKPAALPAHLLKVRGGDLRLFGCRLTGPLGQETGAFETLIDFQGSGEEAGDEPRACAIGDCVLQSAKTALRIRGTGARLRLANNVIVAGENALRFDFGAVTTPRLNMQCVLEHNTVAARRALLDLSDTPDVPAIANPLVVHAKSNLFEDPFLDPPHQASLLRLHGRPIPRGVLLWQGQANAYDHRLKAYVVVEAQGKAQPLPAWRALWGKPGDRQPHVLELPWSPKTPFNLEQPRLERLALPREIRARFSGEVPGADMVGLGILKKLPPP
jgi:serine/threonine-protein kinase